MLARMNDGTFLDWSEAAKGLRQVFYVTTAFNIFFVAALEVVLERFSEDDDVLSELMHFRQEREGGQK